jgi:hypothetical protein
MKYEQSVLGNDALLQLGINIPQFAAYIVGSFTIHLFDKLQVLILWHSSDHDACGIEYLFFDLFKVSKTPQELFEGGFKDLSSLPNVGLGKNYKELHILDLREHLVVDESVTDDPAEPEGIHVPRPVHQEQSFEPNFICKFLIVLVDDLRY